MPNGNPSKGFLFGLIILIGLVVGIPLILSQSQVRQILSGNAWYTSQSASAACAPTSDNVLIKVTFTNQESSRGMLVKAVDNQTGKSVDLGTIAAGKSKTDSIDTLRTSLNSGYVTFKLAWSSSSSGTDTDSRDASYSKVSQCTQPSPTPTPIKPTPTIPYGTPTPTPRTSVTPTPTTCPTPGTVENIKIQCPYCTPSPSPNQ
jgi:hypothetical protein